MRVSILTREYPPHIYGGAGVHVGQLVPQLRKYCDSVEVQCMGEPREGATAHPETFPPGANQALRVLGTDVAMADAIGDVDVIHSHTWYANFAGLVGSKFLDVPHVVTSHSLEPHRPWKAEQLAGGYRVSSWAEKTAFLDAAAVISVSDGMRTDVLASYPELDPARVEVVRNGIDTDEFRPDPATDIVTGLGVDLDRPLVVFVGRITRQKGLVHLVRAAQEFDPDTQLLLLAGAPDTPEIAAEFDTAFAELSRARSGSVTWVQEMLPRASVRQVLSHATVFACPSIYEPLGIVNLEAMACETAVVASAVGGIPEVVADGQTGSLVAYDPAQAGDPAFVADFEARFATQVNRLTRDPGLAAAYGKAGRQRCIDEFSWEKIAQETVAVYQRAIEWHQGH
ncbi:MAG: glycogen synthase [Actinobacteria bacterium HGW-Actinobacteria-2]|nr:MAG: glycogen synthase [Actinobacteria bacterium HGW-Actinobacteria-2]